ncbi:hypothetical protein I3U85_02545 [Mycobacteroides abscessus subsp. abscessus]|uniref:PH domain-containing protein n=1 Tax=Mycobacteroides abscessus TaxID=36809 RepID=UPI0019D1179D|nr:PH domain-containing protein [Mycobacteroides abscessus]MBN7533052.1 hypothetical protein [Mycobacteroides abscessus subsp. abscessus]
MIGVAPAPLAEFHVSRSVPVLLAVGAAWTVTSLPAHATTPLHHAVAISGLVCIACAVAWVVLRPLQRYRSYRWGVLDDTLVYVTSKTLWHRSFWVIPLALVRTVELRQDPLARVLGLAAIRVRADQGELRFVGLEAGVARQAVEWLFIRVDEVSVYR